MEQKERDMSARVSAASGAHAAERCAVRAAERAEHAAKLSESVALAQCEREQRASLESQLQELKAA